MAGFFSRIFEKFSRRKVDWDELEADLVTSDIGIKLALSLIEELQEKGRIAPEEIIDATKAKMHEILPDDAKPLLPREDGLPTVILVVGVNGTGKTTSTAKLAHLLNKSGYSVLLAAADTFRAAAVEQLEAWATRLHIPLYKGKDKQDPSSVCYEAHSLALKNGTQFLICDTAGRLHTRHNLMEELSKIKRTLAKQDETAPHISLIVVDATTGSNALAQAREFQKATPLDGLIVTKLDGSGKGGVAVAIMNELQIPPLFTGTGEGAEDFSEFKKSEYIETLL